jgi:hypothetical protein
MDEIEIAVHVDVDGTTRVSVVDGHTSPLVVPPTLSAIERDAQIVAWIDARKAEAVPPTP